MVIDLITTIIFMIFAFVMTVQSVRLGLGNWEEPGPGFFPAFTTIVIGTLSLVHLISQVRRSRTKEKTEFNLEPQWVKVFGLMLITFLYILFLWDKLGYLIGTTIWLVFVFKLGNIRSWKKCLIFSIGFVIISYFLFEKVGKCFLPKGILGF